MISFQKTIISLSWELHIHPLEINMERISGVSNSTEDCLEYYVETFENGSL